MRSLKYTSIIAQIRLVSYKHSISYYTKLSWPKHSKNYALQDYSSKPVYSPAKPRAFGILAT